MSAIRYAVGFRCDYPECQSVGEGLDDNTPPAGWLHLDYPVMQIVSSVGMQLTDFCSIHSRITITELHEVLYKIRETGHL